VGEICFTVHGVPAPQGSKRHVGNGVMVESSKRVKPWRQDVQAAAEEALLGSVPYLTLWDGPVAVEITFRFARPKGHYRTGRNAHILREAAPQHPNVRPDIDKTTRAVLDALKTAGALKDDAQVTDLHAVKRYCRRDQILGAIITIREIWEQEP
jgi:Holliday junction resolvase RusA-like endonuclease